MIAIIDYGAGNIQSVNKALKYIGCEAFITRDKEQILQADGAVLPGVGSFGDTIDTMNSYGIKDTVIDFINSKKPFLGICLGLQLLFPKSEESPDAKGLGIFDGTISKIPSGDGLKIPHIGWNSLEIKKQTPIFENVKNGEYVYFVHSYYAADCESSVTAVTATFLVLFCTIFTTAIQAQIAIAATKIVMSE